MKKFLIIATTVAILMSIFCVTAFAKVETFPSMNDATGWSDNVKQVMLVQGSNVAIPIFTNVNYIWNGKPQEEWFNIFVYILENYQELLIPISETVYQLNIDSTHNFHLGLLESGEAVITFRYPSKDGSTFEEMFFKQNVENMDDTSSPLYQGFAWSTAVITSNSPYYRGDTLICYNYDFSTSQEFYYSELNSTQVSDVIQEFKNCLVNYEDVPSGYYVNLEGIDKPIKPTEVTDIPSVLLTTLKGFINGIGTTFLGAFQSLFMNKTVSNGVATYSGINSLGIYILIFFGVALGYGVVRWLTGLFRRESR